MHKLNIPKDVIDRVIRHRGREHVYDKFDPTRTALLVVDMQNAFMMPGVAHQLCAEAVNIVPNITGWRRRSVAPAVRWYGSSLRSGRPRSKTGRCCTKWPARTAPRRA